MKREKWLRARELFDDLADVPSEQWSSRLDALGDVIDDELRNDVLILLKADAESSLKTSMGAQAPHLLERLADADEETQRARIAGQAVGPFRLLSELGKGGMGTVWLAERIDGQFQQRVAVKLIRSGWNTSGVMTRFRGERQILAGLAHPNIARLIDGGVIGEDRPWLALEFVDGIDLRQHCDRNQLTIPQRLQLFLNVCDAVSYAHTRLIVHRDLKPSNVIVTGDGVVKLLDFGIAKLIDAEASSATSTRIFTPEYAAPEQIRGEPVTTSVDIYALGLMLYELLVGRHPYRVENSTPTAYERAVLEQEPTRPSSAIARKDVPRPGVSVGYGRWNGARLRGQLRGDLDAIVLKALRKEPTQRYASVSQMSADIVNFLERRPVAARKGGWRYLALRFMRRHALAVGLGLVAAAGLMAGLAAALWQADEARVQRDLARRESSKSTQTVNFLLDIFRSADPALVQGRSVTAEELLKRAVERIESHDMDDPAIHYDLLMSMGEAHLGIGAKPASRGLFEQALSLQEDHFPGDTMRRIRTLVLLARSQSDDDGARLAATYLDEAAQLLPDHASGSHASAELHVTRGINRMALSDIGGAVADLYAGLAITRRLYGVDDDRSVSAAITLSWALDDLDRHDEARSLLEPIVDALRNSPDANPVRMADALDALANTHTQAHEAIEASTMRREALEITKRVYGEQHPYAGIRLNNLSHSLMRAHRYADANAAMREVLAMRVETGAPDASIGVTLNNLASTEYLLGNWTEAERLWEQALVIRRKGNDVGDVAFTLGGSAAAARELGRLADARKRVDEALSLLRAHPSPTPTMLARVLIERTEVDLAEGRVGCDSAEEAMAILRANAVESDPHRIYSEVVAAGCAWRLARTAANRRRLGDAHQAMREVFPADSSRMKQAKRYSLDN